MSENDVYDIDITLFSYKVEREREKIMFSPSSEIAFPLVLITLIGWGMWPFLRSETKFPMPVFCLFNVAGQLMSALVLISSLGIMTYGDNQVNCWNELLSEEYFTSSQTLAIFAGGFVLGHGDHFGSQVMEFLPPGLSYSIYGSLTLVAGTFVDYLLEGSKDSVRLFLGCVLILSAIVCLTKTLSPSKPSTDKLIADQINEINQIDHDENDEENKLDETSLPRSSSFDVSKPLIVEETHTITSSTHKSKTNLAFLVLFLAACFSAFWSPLLLIGHRDNDKPTGKTYVALLTFACGELVALPSVVMSGLYIHRKMNPESSKTSFLQMILDLANPRSVVFGLLTGFAISMGYMCYLNAITVLPSTTVFPIVSCNPVVSVIYNVVVLGEFKNSPKSRWIWLIFALMCYASAIATIASIPQ